MQLAAANAMIAIGALSGSRALAPESAELVRLGAQLQFAHSMAAIASATFINVGAQRARHAPAPLLCGSIVVAGAYYLEAAGAPIGIVPLILGTLSLVSGWAVLIASAVDIDGTSAA